MTEKEEFDSFMELANFQQVGFERRVEIEWKINLSLWASIFILTSYYLNNDIKWPCVKEIYLIFITLYSIWLGLLGRANATDKTFMSYYRNRAERSISIKVPPIKRPTPRLFLVWDIWLIIEIIITGLFLYVSNNLISE